ncbi:putative reverse transcriptase domain-containing protein [Tanacetum coccineum]
MLLMEEYCPDDEVQKLESEFWNHKMVGSDIDGYTTRFHKLSRLVPHMVTPESQRVNRYIRGLALEIKAHVTSSKPATIQGASKDKGNVNMLINIRSVQNATFFILVTAMCVVDVTKWVTLPDTARVELLMKDQGQLALSVEILNTLGGIV